MLLSIKNGKIAFLYAILAKIPMKSPENLLKIPAGAGHHTLAHILISIIIT